MSYQIEGKERKYKYISIGEACLDFNYRVVPANVLRIKTSNRFFSRKVRKPPPCNSAQHSNSTFQFRIDADQCLLFSQARESISRQAARYSLAVDRWVERGRVKWRNNFSALGVSPVESSPFTRS